MARNFMQLYVDNVDITGLDNDQVDITISGFDVSQVVSEIGNKEILDEMDFADISDYLNKRLLEDDEE